jgi:hypothetical protein
MPTANGTIESNHDQGDLLSSSRRAAGGYDRLASFFSALGFAPASRMEEETSRGASFLAPLGNLEFVDGEFPSTADVLVEVTALDAVHQAARHGCARKAASIPGARALAHHGDPLEVAHLHRRAGAGLRVQLLGVDRSAAGKPSPSKAISPPPE